MLHDLLGLGHPLQSLNILGRLLVDVVMNRLLNFQQFFLHFRLQVCFRDQGFQPDNAAGLLLLEFQE